MRSMMVMAFVIGSSGMAAAETSPTPKLDMSTADLLEGWLSCTQEQAKKDATKSDGYQAKLCGCGVDYERTRRIAKKAKAALLTEAGPTKQCHTYAKANEKATKSNPTPFSPKLHRSTDQLVGAFAGCYEGGTKANPPMPEDKARSVCFCMTEAVRKSTLTIDKLQSDPGIAACLK